MGKPRRTEIAKIADPAARLVTYSKRRKGLFNKASELCRLCGVRMAVIVFSPAGKPCSFGDPSAEEIIVAYLGGGEVTPSMGLDEWAEWVETEWAACTTEEDLESLILKYEAVSDCARERLKALEGDSQVKMGLGDPHILSEDEIDSIFDSLNGQGPALSALLASPDKLVAGDGNLAVEPTPAPSSLGVDGFDPDGFLNLFEDGNSDGFKTSLEDLAVGGGSSGVEPTRSDVQGNDANDFAWQLLGDPSAEEIITAYHGDDDMMSPMGLAGLAEWLETEWAACTTEEDLESLILRYEAVRRRAWEKLKALEGDSQVKMGSGDPHILSEEETDSIFESLNGQGPVLSALLASPNNSAAGEGNLAVEPAPAPSDLGVDGFDPEDFLNLFEDGNGDGSKTSPEDLAVGGGSSGVESRRSNVQSYGHDPRLLP